VAEIVWLFAIQLACTKRPVNRLIDVDFVSASYWAQDDQTING